jgi:polysaccharide export outer membrane protein
VRLDGKMSMPLVNDFDAAGLTCKQLRDQLIVKYSSYVGAPEVSVTLLESRSMKMYLLGKVNKPGEYPLQKNMTVVQAILLASGLTRLTIRDRISESKH